MKPCIETWLREQFGDDAEMIGEIYAEYRATLARLTDELDAALAAGDRAATDRALHTVKGSALMVGDGPVADIAIAARSQLDESAALAEAARKIRASLGEL